jgi:hypothetical protein
MSVMARRLIASVSIAAIGFTVSLVSVPLAHAHGGRLDTDPDSAWSGAAGSDGTTNTATRLELAPLATPSVAPEQHSPLTASTSTVATVTNLRAIEFPQLPRPAYASLLDTNLPRIFTVAPDFEAPVAEAGSPLFEAPPVPAPMPHETDALRSSGSGGGIFQSLDDMAANLAGLLGAAGSSSGAAAGGGISVAILVAILVVAARLLMSLQWSTRSGVPEPLPVHIVVPPG